jgi:hypothetical protein
MTEPTIPECEQLTAADIAVRLGGSKRGAIYHELAYAQGKMLDHSGWGGKLPRKITPSDIDFFFDNDGSFLICELVSSQIGWSGLGFGQRRAHENFLNGTWWISALCRHSVPRERQINTYTDIDKFLPMVWANGQYYCSECEGGEMWPRFVDWWFDDALRAYKWICERAS